MYVGSHRK